MAYPKAVLFDLLTALLDSWSVWNAAASSEHAGRTWRAEYLRLTYGCGAYRPYETLVREAAETTQMQAGAADALEANWSKLQAWSGARELLQSLEGRTKIAVVTNCSKRLGHEAAALLGVNWDAVITSEEAGFYKPHPRPYELALERLQVKASEAAFIAGSAYDLFGTKPLGIKTYWHNRVGLARPEGAPVADVESADLDEARVWLGEFKGE
jgi:2-haloacid dehalogenase